MNETLTLAWRNLWRNKRRTFITIASVFFAVFLAIVMRGFHLGMWSSLLESVLHSYPGYIQVQHPEYERNRTLDYTMLWADSETRLVANDKNVVNIIPRLETFALASMGDRTKGVMVAGVDPVKENEFTRLGQRLTQGNFLDSIDSGVVISQRLAKYLKITLADTLVLLGQGYQGVSAAGLFPVRGIVRLPSPEWDNKMVYMSLPAARQFLSTSQHLTSVVVDVRQPGQIDRTSQNLAKMLPAESFKVLTWKEILRELHQQFEMDNASGILIIGLLYLITGFGIFGTVMMMMSERHREFAIMVAVGMKRYKLAKLLSMEMLIIAIIGVITGMAASLPLVYYFHIHPIEVSGEMAKTFSQYGLEPYMGTLWQARYILNQGGVIFLLTLAAISYPVGSLLRFDVAKKLKD